jgi:hypothetical protein
MLPDTSFRSLFLLTGMTTCGCYSQPEDTEMITSVVGTFRTWRAGLTMSVVRGRPEVASNGPGTDLRCDVVTPASPFA